MRGACAGECCKFGSIGVGVTGAPRSGPFHATDLWGVSWGAQKFYSIGVGVTGAPRLWPFKATDLWGVRAGAPQIPNWPA